MRQDELTIEQRYFIKSAPEKVFLALTDPSELTRWFLFSAKVDQRKGGDYSFVWNGGYTHAGKVLHIAKDRRVTYSWPQSWKNAKVGVTKVTFSLKKKGVGTVLSVRHTGYKRTGGWVELYGLTQSGWAYYLMNLKSVLEHGYDLRSPGDV